MAQQRIRRGQDQWIADRMEGRIRNPPKMQHRAQAAIQVYRSRRVFLRVGRRPKFLSEREPRTGGQEQRKTKDERERRRVDSFEAKDRRFARITNGLSGFLCRRIG